MWRPLRTSLIVLVATSLSAIIALTAWFAWDHRGASTNWQSAASALEAEGHCAPFFHLLWKVIDAGDMRAYDRYIAAMDNGPCTDTYVSSSLLAQLDPKSREILTSSDSGEAYKRAQQPAHFTDAARAFRARWSAEAGWRDLGSFALRHWAEPALVTHRAQIWLNCASSDLHSTPIDHAAIDRAVAHHACKGARPVQSDREARRIWCRQALLDLAPRLAQGDEQNEARYDARRLGTLAAKYRRLTSLIDGSLADFTDEQRADPALKRYAATADWFDRLEVLAVDERYGPAQALIAEWYLNGYDDPQSEVPASPFFAALWAGIAQDYGTDTDDLLMAAKAKLAPHHIAQLTHARQCWEQFPYYMTHHVRRKDEDVSINSDQNWKTPDEEINAFFARCQTITERRAAMKAAPPDNNSFDKYQLAPTAYVPELCDADDETRS